MSDNSRAYNSVWQLRGDSWCRLEEAADRLSRPTTNSELKDEYIAICRDLLDDPDPARALLGLSGHATVRPGVTAVRGGQTTTSSRTR